MSYSQTGRTHYLNADYGVKSWLLTVDHKRIAMLYLAAVTFFFALGGLMAVLIRLELATPTGDLVSADTTVVTALRGRESVWWPAQGPCALKQRVLLFDSEPHIEVSVLFGGLYTGRPGV